MNNVHEDAPVVFETRWALSYLRGPLTRSQIKTLMAGPQPPPRRARRRRVRPRRPPAAVGAGRRGHPPPPGRPVLPPGRAAALSSPCGTPARRRGARLPADGLRRGRRALRRRQEGASTRTTPVVVVTPITAEAVAVDWDRAVDARWPPGDLEASPDARAAFAELPPAAGKPKSYDGWRKDLAAWLFRTRRLDLLTMPAPQGASRSPARPRATSGRASDTPAASSAMSAWSAPQEVRAEEGRARREAPPRRAGGGARVRAGHAAGLQVAISIGATVIGAFLGRKAISATTLGRATTAARGAGRVLKERQDVGRAQETVEALQAGAGRSG